MSDWRRGYFAESGYTFGFYQETMPTWIQWASALQMHNPPNTKFRYLDAGCGQGINLVIAAANHPESEFVGIDFFPEHIAHGRRIARACNLKNITFIEGDFVETAEQTADLGEFDYIVSHGITSWISETVRDSLFKIIQKTLLPGGIFYNSYNTQPGWLYMMPFQNMVQIERQQRSGSEAIDSATTIMDEIINASSIYNNRLPGQIERLEQMRRQDRAYLIQEYNNEHWKPLFFREMLEYVKPFKLDYMGTATLLEVGYAFLPDKIQNLMRKDYSPVLREQILDYALLKSFRRDLYVKGASRPWKLGREHKLNQFIIGINPLQSIPEDRDAFPVKVGSISFQINGSYFYEILEAISQNGNEIEIGKLLKTNKYNSQKERTLHAINYLISQNFIYIKNTSSSATSSAQQCNRIFAQEFLKGAPYTHFILPQSGSAIANTDLEWLMISCLLNGVSRERWIDTIIDQLNALGRSMTKEGKDIQDKAEIEIFLTAHIEAFVKNKSADLIKMGAIS